MRSAEITPLHPKKWNPTTNPDGIRNPALARPLSQTRAELHVLRSLVDFPDLLIKNNDSPLLDVETEEAYAFFVKHGAKQEMLEQAFHTETGKFKIQGDESFDPYSKPVDVLYDELVELTRPLASLCDTALDSTREYGYNSHDLPHTEFVTRKALAFARALGLSEDVQRDIVIEGLLHDVGNIVDREYHAILAAYFRRHLLPGADRDRRRAREIDRAMNLHDSEPFESRFRALGLKTAEEKIKFIQRYGPSFPLVLAADKAHVGRKRVSSKANAEAAVEDIHTALNLVWTTDSLYIDPERKVMVWNVDFDKDISDDELEYLWPLTRQSKDGQREAIYPAHIVLKRERTHKQWQDLWAEEFVQVYGERMKTFVIASFAMSDKIQNVEIHFRDKYAPASESYRDIEAMRFSRGDLDGQFDYYGIKGKSEESTVIDKTSQSA